MSKTAEFGEHVAAYMEACPSEYVFFRIAIWNRFVEHGEVGSLRQRTVFQHRTFLDQIKEYEEQQ